jgi:hypothetical protein
MRALKPRAGQIGLAQIRAVEISAFEMAAAQGQSVLDGIEFFGSSIFIASRASNSGSMSLI